MAKAKITTDNLVRYATFLSVFTASLILISKIYGWSQTNSVSILASLIDSGLDIASSVINVMAVRFAFIPADDDHRFGHYKIIDLAVFAQSVFFISSGIFLLVSAVNRVVYQEAMSTHDVGIYVMIFSTVMTTLLVSFQTYVISKTKSSIIEADKLHYFTDLLTNLSVIASIYFSKRLDVTYLDPIVGVLLAAYIIKGAYKLLRRSFDNLMDKEFDEIERSKILEALKSFPEIKTIHELKTRRAGDKAFIQFHMELEGEMNLYQAHRISDQVELKLQHIFPHAEIIIHLDPAGLEKNVNYRIDLHNV